MTKITIFTGEILKNIVEIRGFLGKSTDLMKSTENRRKSEDLLGKILRI